MIKKKRVIKSFSTFDDNNFINHFQEEDDRYARKLLRGGGVKILSKEESRAMALAALNPSRTRGY